jgi:hypothetical protein
MEESAFRIEAEKHRSVRVTANGGLFDGIKGNP